MRRLRPSGVIRPAEATGGLDGLGAPTAPACRLNVTESTVALAWLFRRSSVIVPIPGTKSIRHLDDNLRAAAVATELSDIEIQALTAAEDETTATLTAMPTRMLDALRRPGGTNR